MKSMSTLYAVEKLLIEKKDLVRKFEEEFCDDTSKVASGEIVIDLTGPEGNVFTMARADSFAKQLGFDGEARLSKRCSLVIMKTLFQCSINISETTLYWSVK